MVRGLTEHLAATLERCGLPRRPGEVMATNPARRVPCRAWQDQFGSWIQEPEEEALLEAAIFFDFRQLHGDLDAEGALGPVIRGRPATGGSSAAWPGRRCGAGHRSASCAGCAATTRAGST